MHHRAPHRLARTGVLLFVMNPAVKLPVGGRAVFQDLLRAVKELCPFPLLTKFDLSGGLI
jgi:hypothetical protein